MGKAGQVWSDDELQILYDMRVKAGMPYKAIAEKLGRPVGGLANQVNRLGWPAPKRLMLTAKQEAAWKLRQKGLSYAEVGRVLGIATCSAYKLVQKALDWKKLATQGIYKVD